jgi:P27 family predicted phage terminase small subunit
MGARGAPKAPTKLAVLRGEKKADRLNFDQPMPKEGGVEPPETLSPAARTHWDRYAPELIEIGVLTRWDTDAFAMAMEALARYWAATRLVNGSALLVQGSSGLAKNPALLVQRDAELTFMQYGGRFGLTPSDRTAIKMNGPSAAKGPSAQRLLS